MPEDILFRGRYRIPSVRCPGWDYRWAGVYFVTICTLERMRCLGDVLDGRVSLSPVGKIVAEKWLKIPTDYPHVVLDEWIIMPDHMHGILIFESSMQDSLGTVIGRFKASCTKRIWGRLNRSDFDWQTRFYDNIVRGPENLEQARVYIRNNPIRWKA